MAALVVLAFGLWIVLAVSDSRARDSYISSNEQLIASIGAPPGAQLVSRESGGYAPSGEAGPAIRHKGWITHARFNVRGNRSGVQVAAHFRSVLAKWHCSEDRSSATVTGFACTRGDAGLWLLIQRNGDYELSVDHERQSVD